MLLWPGYRDRLKLGSRTRRFLTISPVGLYRLMPPGESWHALNVAWSGKTKDPRNVEGLVETHGVFPLYSWTKQMRKHWVRTTSDDRQERVVAETEFRLFDPLRPLDLPGFEISESPLELIPSLFKVRKRDGVFERWELPYDLFDWREWTEDRYDSSLTVGTWFVFNYRIWEPWREENEEVTEFRNRDLQVLSFFWNDVRKDTHSQGLWPIYTYKKKEKGGLNVSVLDPLWFWGEATGEEEHVSAFLKIFDYRRRPDGASRFSFIWRAFRRDKQGDAVSTEMFPFLYFEKSPDGSRFSFFWRLFQLERREDQRSMRVFFSPQIGL